MVLSTGEEVLISLAGNCHNGDVGSVVKVTTFGALVRVRDCVHLYDRARLRPVPAPDTIPTPVVV